MIRESEFVALGLGLLTVAIVLIFLRPIRRRDLVLFYTALFALVAAGLFTVLEDFVFHEAFTLLEHLFSAAAGALLLAACMRLRAAAPQQPDDS